MTPMTKYRQVKKYLLILKRPWLYFDRLAISVIFSTLVMATFAQGNNKEPRFPENYPVIHPQFRKWASPALNNEAGSVSPTLCWSANRKGKNTYDVRLSMDSTFHSADIIDRENIPWTLFNPHQQLHTGSWYWQYRLHNDLWSDVLKFRVSNDAIKNFAPPVQQFWSAIPKEHPRTLINKRNEISFVQKVKRNEDALVILKTANDLLNTVLPNENEGESDSKGSKDVEKRKLEIIASLHASNRVYNAIDLFCKAYIISNDKKYKQKTIEWAMIVAGWDPNGVSHSSDFGDARCMISMAEAFDTFNDDLDPSQRVILLKSIQARASRFYHEWINNIDAKVLSNHVWQYILHYFFQTAIAVYGDVDEAKDWINYAYELWLARAPVLGGGDGGWGEGASYFRLNMETLLGIPMIIKEYTGFDFFKDNVWFQKNPYWMAYSFPAGSSSDGFGDDVEKIYSPGTEYLAYADALSKLTGNQMAAWYANKIEQAGKNDDTIEERVNGITSYMKKNNQVEKIKPSDANMLRWFRLRYLLNLKRPDPIDSKSLPASEVFKGVGIADMHSDIADTKKDLMISFRSSPYGSYGHLLADQNTFNILSGGKRLFYMSGHKVAMQDPHRLGWYKATIGHNGILIDGKGQPSNTEAYGYISRFLNGENVSYVVGDASQAYSSKTEGVQTGLTKFNRHLLFLHPNILLVYDELEADHPAKWSWLVHSPFKILMDTISNTFRCDSGNISAKGLLFSKQSLHWELSDTFAIPAVNWIGREDEDGNLVEYKNDQWHLIAFNIQKSAKMRFLAVFVINPSGKILSSPLPYKFNDKNELIIDKWIIKAELNGDKPALLEAHTMDDKIIFNSATKSLTSGNKEYVGKINGSAKLLERINGNYRFSEAGNMVPEVVKSIPVKDTNIKQNLHEK